jgi:hypothetical protein
MDIEKFISHSPFLYHLTCKQNAENIINAQALYSANALIDKTKQKKNVGIKTNKRFSHEQLIIDGLEVFLRDQRPISEKALSKCLTDNWNVSDFLYHLNDRVFMWPNLDRLQRHFKRYEKEKPIIFRFDTRDLISANKHAKFCRLNSGATRPSSYLGGIAPERGPNTFVTASDFSRPVREVAEVTFEKHCNITGLFGLDSYPLGDFKKALVNL